MRFVRTSRVFFFRFEPRARWKRSRCCEMIIQTHMFVLKVVAQPKQVNSESQDMFFSNSMVVVDPWRFPDYLNLSLDVKGHKNMSLLLSLVCPLVTLSMMGSCLDLVIGIYLWFLISLGREFFFCCCFSFFFFINARSPLRRKGWRLCFEQTARSCYTILSEYWGEYLRATPQKPSVSKVTPEWRTKKKSRRNSHEKGSEWAQERLAWPTEY